MKARILKVPPVPPPDEVELTISRPDAEVLKRFLGMFGGPSKAYTVICDVYGALDAVGVRSSEELFTVQANRAAVTVIDRKP